MYPQTPIVIDIESSGFGPDSYPIEIGVALSSGMRLSMLVRPEPDWSFWDERAEAVHGITRSLLLSHGRPVKQVATLLNGHLQGLKTYCDGWVVDKPWLTRLFRAAGIDMQFQLSPIEQLMSEPQMERWDSVKQQVLSESRESRHRASFDAWIIQQTWLRSRLADAG